MTDVNAGFGLQDGGKLYMMCSCAQALRKVAEIAVRLMSLLCFLFVSHSLRLAFVELIIVLHQSEKNYRSRSMSYSLQLAQN